MTSIKIDCRTLCLALLMSGPVWVGSAWPESMRLGILSSVVGYRPYVWVGDQQIQGEVVDVFDCVARGEQFNIEYNILPIKRGLHELRSGALDVFLPIPVAEDSQHLWQPGVVFSTMLHPGYWMFVQKQGRALKVTPPFTRETRLASYPNILHHGVFQGADFVSIPNDVQMYRLLISDRVDLISVYHPWPIEQIHSYAGVPLQAHLIRESPYRAAISEKSAWSEDVRLVRLNQRIAQCRERFKVIAVNPFAKKAATAQ